MSAKVLTKAAAKEAKIELIEDGRGTQAVHETIVAMRAARRSGSARGARTKDKSVLVVAEKTDRCAKSFTDLGCVRSNYL